MFLVETYVCTSNIDGVGLYTKHDILAGTVAAKWNSDVDRVFDDSVFKSLPDIVQQYIHKHGTKDNRGRWKLGMDGDQYINHSTEPNLLRKDDKLIAIKTIRSGQELTCDYRPFRNDIS